MEKIFCRECGYEIYFELKDLCYWLVWEWK